MSVKMYANLPVEDLAVSKRFFTELGFAFNEQWSDENVEAIVVSDEAGVLLFAKSYFKTFTPREVADATSTTEVVLSLGVETRARVDELADKALAVGGRPANETQDLGFMYTRSFADPDGHLWEVIWMDMAGAPQACPGGRAGRDRPARPGTAPRDGPPRRPLMTSEAIDQYVKEQLQPEHQDIVAILRELMKACAPGSEEVIRYGSPAWKDRNFLAIISRSKTHVTFAFERGAEFDDAHGLLEGTGKRTRHVKIKSVADMDRDALRDYIGQAVRLDAA
ncbi:DUF1801 domain-containing protein [Actinomadura scrupuli]|uniref:DUF1801 domain-containing protein n=1 Tax=Actinomadura scrupuli TaxID=559629 RepID=UPI003D97CB81